MGAELLVGPRYVQRVPAMIEAAGSEVRVAMFQLQALGKKAKGSSAVLSVKLWAKAREGKDVRVLLSNAGGGHRVPAINRHSAGWLQEKGVGVRHLGGSRVCHAKIVIVDRALVVIGSHNWTPTSVTRNFEVSVALDDPGLVAVLVEHFDVLWTVARKF